jgi:HAD superfamily hydrolase (TIGR01509 family)
MTIGESDASRLALRSVLFDLGDVLVRLRWDRCFVRVGQAVVFANPSLVPVNTDMKGIVASIGGSLQPGGAFYALQMEYFAGRVPAEEFIGKMFRFAGDLIFGKDAKLDMPSFEAQVEAWSDLFDPWPEMMDVAESVAKLGHDIYILSNTDAMHWSVLTDREKSDKRLVDILEGATGTWLSYQAGLSKPDQKYWTLFLEQHKLTKQECIFVDDNEDNVDAARKVGLRAFRHYRNDMSTLRSWLHGNGVMVEGAELFG